MRCRLTKPDNAMTMSSNDGTGLSAFCCAVTALSVSDMASEFIQETGNEQKPTPHFHRHCIHSWAITPADRSSQRYSWLGAALSPIAWSANRLRTCGFTIPARTGAIHKTVAITGDR